MLFGRTAAALSVALGLMALGATARAADPKVIVFPTKGKGGPNLKPSMKKMVETPLTQGKVGVVPFAAFSKAAKKLKIKPKDLASPMSAQSAGEAAGATHVLIVEGIMEQLDVGKKKKKKVFFANVSLIDVTSGDVVFSNRWELQGKKLTKVAAAQLVDGVVKALSGAGTAVASNEPGPEPVPPPEPPPGPDPATLAASTDTPGLAALTDEAATGETNPAAPPAETAPPVEEQPVAAEPIAEPPPSLFPTSSTTTASILIPEPMASTVSQKIELEPERSGRWRPGLHALAGPAGMMRTASLKVPLGAVQRPPCYCVPNGGMNPIFPAGVAIVELFPLAFGGTGAWYEGFGMHLEGLYTRVSTQVSDDPGDLIESNIYGGRGGLSYRLVWWDSEIAPSFRLDAGVSYFAFPLSEGAFPGVQYFGQLYVGGMFEVPLFTKYLALLAGGTYTALAEPRGRTHQLGDEGPDGTVSIKRQTTFMAQGGLQFQLSFFEARALFRYERYEYRFNGETTLPLPVQFRSAKLTDDIMYGMLLAGVQF